MMNWNWNNNVIVLSTIALVAGVGYLWLKKRRNRTKKQKSYRRKPWYTKETDETKAYRAALHGTADIKPPTKINLDALLAMKKSAVGQLIEELKNRNYACIQVDSETRAISQNLTDVALEYLGQDMEVKLNNKDPNSNNIGFVEIPGIREYMKLRVNDPPHLWPTHPQNFKSALEEFHQKYTKIALACFDILSEWVDPDEPVPQNFIRKEDHEIIRQVLPDRSSISMIKYYPLKDDTEVCDEHTDTGIMTFITRTSRPALEIWDRSEKKYVKVEELLNEGDIVVFISEKVPLFSCSMRFRAAHHRVRMAAGKDRLSIAYLLDVAN